MRKIFECFFAVVFLLAFAAPASAADRIRVVVYGDSLTSGYQLTEEASYAAMMGKKIKEIGYTNVDTLNMSIPGETTAGGLERLSSLLVKQPDIAVVALGGNDIIRGLNPNLIHRNIAHIVSRLKESNVYVVLIGMKAPPNMGTDYAAKIDNVYESIASYYQVAYYPFALDGIYGKPEMNLADGYHPNAKGIELMVENTYRLVDAGLRWKWEVMQYQEEYQRNWKEQVSGKSDKPVPDPAGGGDLQQFTPQPVLADPSAPTPPPAVQ